MAYLYGVLGWLIPGVAAAIPFVGRHESVGGLFMIAAGLLWILALGPVGCAVAGWYSAHTRAARTPWNGMAGAATSIVAVVAIEEMVPVITLGPVAFLVVAPLVVGHGIGVAIGSFTRRRIERTGSLASLASQRRRVLAGVGICSMFVLAALAVSRLSEPRSTFSATTLSLCLVAAGFVAATAVIKPSVGAGVILGTGVLLAWPLPRGFLRSVMPGVFDPAGDIGTLGALILLTVALALAVWRHHPSQTPTGSPIQATRFVNRLVLVCVVGGLAVQVLALAIRNSSPWPLFIGSAVAVFGLLVYGGYAAFQELVTRPTWAAILAVVYPAVLLAVAVLGPPWITPAPVAADGMVENRLADGRVVRASRASPVGPPRYAVDGRADTVWNAGASAPASIEVDLGEPASITEVTLLVAQSPAGETVHEVIAIETTGRELRVVEFRGVTRDGDTLSTSLPATMPDVKAIRITTVASPSWVAWREIQLTTSPR